MKGLVGQLVSAILVYNLVAGIRRGLGYTVPNWQVGIDEPSIVLAGLFSVIGFLLACGVLNDWLSWTVGGDPPLKHGNQGRPGWARYFNVDVNHKVIGIQYGMSSLFILLVGGTLAILFRLELATPGLQFLTGDTYNTLFSSHGIIMIASNLAGVGALINYLGPVLLGASDMAYPRLNAFSYWISIPSATLIISGIFLGGWDTGWVAYPTHSTTTTMIGVQLFLMGFYMNGFSSIASGLNMVVTTVYMRAKGMTYFRMPIFVWAAIAASLVQATVTQTVGVALTMVIAQRTLGMDFFTPILDPILLEAGVPGGDATLFQHLF
ncbi:MAG: cbb3-type cytochrome c oxidase subunit I, partial [Bacteroidota bacterium]